MQRKEFTKKKKFQNSLGKQETAKDIVSPMANYAVVYRAKNPSVEDENASVIVRESGMTFLHAQRRAKDVNGEIHRMSGVKSFRVS